MIGDGAQSRLGSGNGVLRSHARVQAVRLLELNLVSRVRYRMTARPLNSRPLSPDSLPCRGLSPGVDINVSNQPGASIWTSYASRTCARHCYSRRSNTSHLTFEPVKLCCPRISRQVDLTCTRSHNWRRRLDAGDNGKEASASSLGAPNCRPLLRNLLRMRIPDALRHLSNNLGLVVVSQ